MWTSGSTSENHSSLILYIKHNEMRVLNFNELSKKKTYSALICSAMAACPRLCTVGQFDIRFSSFKAMPPKGTAMPLNIMIVKKVSNLSIFYLHTPILHGKIYFNRSS